MHLLLFVLLTSSALFGAEYPVTAFGATCNGSADDSAAFSAAIAAAYANGGGTVKTPAGKTCVVPWGVVVFSTTQMETPITIEGEPGSVLKCTLCGAGITVGGSGYLTYNKTIRNLIIDISGSNNTAVSGVVMNNTLKGVLDNVRVVNSTVRSSTTGVYFYNGGGSSCSFPGGTTVCFGAHNTMFNPDFNGVFNYGIRLQGSRPEMNDNNNHNMVVGGRIAITRTCQGICYGIYGEGVDTLDVFGTDIEGGHYGVYARGLNFTFTGLRTEGNLSGQGVYFDNVGGPGSVPTRAYNHRLVGSNVPEGWSLCDNCSAIESYNQYGQVSVLPRERRVWNTPLCTTAAVQGATCDTTAIFPNLPNTQYAAVCTAQGSVGLPLLSVQTKNAGSLVLRVTAAGNAASGGGLVDCKIDYITAF